MGLFARFGSWLDKGLEKIFGKPKVIPIEKEILQPIEPRRYAYERMKKEVMELWREERVPVWQRRMEEAIDKHREEGMDEEEIVERYGEFA